MLRGIPVLKLCVNVHLHELDNLLRYKLIKKPLKGVLRRKNMNPNDYVHCCVISCHGYSLLYLI